jgi:uncharacterized Ntn-hydrolase superfamily protein
MTFSLLAFDPESRSIGSVIASNWPSVGSCVPYFRPQVGVMHSQNCANPATAESCLDRMASGMSLEDSLNATLRNDSAPQRRQCILCDFSGNFYLHSGDDFEPVNHHRAGEECAAAGNTLVSAEVIEAMVSAYESAANVSFPEKLLLALEAGERAGGDRRGRAAASLRVLEWNYPHQQSLQLDLRVDSHPSPIEELRRLYDLFLSEDRSVVR